MKKEKDLADLFEYFTYQELDITERVLRVSRQRGLSIGDLNRNVLRKRLQAYKKKAAMVKMALATYLCPECLSKIALYPVNSCDATRVPGEYKCQWFCDPDRGGCGWEDYRVQEPEEVLEEIMKKAGFSA